MAVAVAFVLVVSGLALVWMGWHGKNLMDFVDAFVPIVGKGKDGTA